jgi:hypothetical protein
LAKHVVQARFIFIFRIQQQKLVVFCTKLVIWLVMYMWLLSSLGSKILGCEVSVASWWFMMHSTEAPMDFKPYKIKWGFWKEVLGAQKF